MEDREKLDSLLAQEGIEVLAQRVDIKDGDVIAVTMRGVEIGESTVQAFKKALKTKFPKVEFIVLNLPPNNEVEFKKLT